MAFRRRKKHVDSAEGAATSKSGRKLPVKALLLVALLVLALGAAYMLGKNKSDSVKSSSDLRNSSAKRNYANASNSKPGSTSTNSKSSDGSKKLPSSNGRIILVGEITAISEDEVSVKTANGDTKTFSLEKEVRVSSAGKSGSKIEDVKKGNKAQVMVSVKSDGAFQVQSIRIY